MTIQRVIAATILVGGLTQNAFAHDELKDGFLITAKKGLNAANLMQSITHAVIQGKPGPGKEFGFTATWTYTPSSLHEDGGNYYIFVTADSIDNVNAWIKSLNVEAYVQGVRANRF